MFRELLRSHHSHAWLVLFPLLTRDLAEEGQIVALEGGWYGLPKTIRSERDAQGGNGGWTGKL